TGGHGVGRLRPVEQAGRFRARHQRDHGEGSPRQGDAQNEGWLSRRPGEYGRKTPPRTRADRLTHQRRPVVVRLLFAGPFFSSPSPAPEGIRNQREQIAWCCAASEGNQFDREAGTTLPRACETRPVQRKPTNPPSAS